MADAPPAYLALDLWMALGFDSRDFDTYYERNGWANTWSNLLAGVRDIVGREFCLQVVDNEYCQLEAGHMGPHMGESDLGYGEPLPVRKARISSTDSETR